jgi:hypothetical protein
MIFARPNRRANVFMEDREAPLTGFPFSLLRNEMNRDLLLAEPRG